MKVIGKIIGGLAGFAFMLGMSMIDGNTELAFGMMFISGIVLSGFAFYAYFEEEEARLKEGRR